MTEHDLRALEAAVQDEFPDFILRRLGDSVVAEGRYTLFENGKAADQFEICVELPREHQEGYPTLFETGGRIPVSADRHVNEDAGRCCVMASDELLFKYPSGCSLLDFLRGPVRDFLISQSYFEAHERWPFGERAHGLKGRLEFYAEQVDSSDPTVGLRVLSLVAAATASGKVDCPCGSRRRLRKCHREAIRRLRERIPQRVAKEVLSILEQGLEKTPRRRVPTKPGTPRRRRWWPTS